MTSSLSGLPAAEFNRLNSAGGNECVVTQLCLRRPEFIGALLRLQEFGQRTVDDVFTGGERIRDACTLKSPPLQLSATNTW